MKKFRIFCFALLCLSFGLATAQPANYAFDPNRIYLDSKEGHGGTAAWAMKKAGDVSLPAEQLSMPGKTTTDWMPAIVPGTVLNSLVFNKVYPEPYYGVNNKLDSNLIPDLSKAGRDFYTYWFRTEFTLPESYADKRVWMQLDGINYRAEVWLNGNLLATMDGMFKDERIDITDFAQLGKPNALAVKVYPVDMPGTTRQKPWGAAGEFFNGGDGNIGLNTTMLMCVGWDFSFLDGIRDRNTGIWKSISIYTTGNVDMRHPFVKSELSKPGYDTAREEVSVELVNPTPKPVKCRVEGEITGTGITFAERDRAFPGREPKGYFHRRRVPATGHRQPAVVVAALQRQSRTLRTENAGTGGRHSFRFGQNPLRHPRSDLHERYA